MTITIELTEAEERQLQQVAAARGLNTHEYARTLVVEGSRPRPSLDEILAPFREQISASELTSAELDTLFAEAREESFDNRRKAA